MRVELNHRKFHAAETALLHLHNEILSLMDDFKSTALTLLNFLLHSIPFTMLFSCEDSI